MDALATYGKKVFSLVVDNAAALVAVPLAGVALVSAVCQLIGGWVRVASPSSPVRGTSMQMRLHSMYEAGDLEALVQRYSTESVSVNVVSGKMCRRRYLRSARAVPASPTYLYDRSASAALAAELRSNARNGAGGRRWTVVDPDGCPSPSPHLPRFRLRPQVAMAAAWILMVVLYLRSLLVRSRPVHLVDFEVAHMPER